jgi:hypothetical protein
MFTPPSRAALPIFTDEDSKPHAGATVAVFAALTQFQHPILQFVADYPTPWWRRSNLDRGRSRWGAILWHHHDPRSVGALLVAGLLVVPVSRPAAVGPAQQWQRQWPRRRSRRLQPRARRPMLRR